MRAPEFIDPMMVSPVSHLEPGRTNGGSVEIVTCFGLFGSPVVQCNYRLSVKVVHHGFVYVKTVVSGIHHPIRRITCQVSPGLVHQLNNRLRVMNTGRSNSNSERQTRFGVNTLMKLVTEPLGFITVSITLDTPIGILAVRRDVLLGL
jgi:hypothetical protein